MTLNITQVQPDELKEGIRDTLAMCGRAVAAASDALENPSTEEHERCVTTAAHAYANMQWLFDIITNLIDSKA